MSTYGPAEEIRGYERAISQIESKIRKQERDIGYYEKQLARISSKTRNADSIRINCNQKIAKAKETIKRHQGVIAGHRQRIATLQRR